MRLSLYKEKFWKALTPYLTLFQMLISTPLNNGSSDSYYIKLIIIS